MSAQITTTGAEPASTGSVTRSKWAALAVLSVAQLMVILDTTIVNVALPSIQKDLHFTSEADLQWVVNAYVLTAGGFLLLGGRSPTATAAAWCSSPASSSSRPPASPVGWPTRRHCSWFHGPSKGWAPRSWPPLR